MDNLWTSWYDLNRICSGRKIVFFGQGELVDKTVAELQFDGDMIVDNKKYIQGSSYKGIKIYSPEKLLEMKPEGKFIVVITTTGFMGVIEQLSTYGLVAGRDFVVSPALNNYKIVDEVERVSSKVLLSCYDALSKSDNKGGGLYLYDIESMQLDKIFNGRCHGMTKVNGGLAIVDDLIMGIRILDNDFNKKEKIELPEKVNLHGLAYDEKRNCIAVAQSGTDSICFYNLNDYKLHKEISISDKHSLTGIPQHHVNDIFVDGDSLYASMFSFTGNWKKGVWDGGVLEFNIETGKCYGPVVSGLWCPHSVTSIGGQLCYLDSMRGTLHNATWGHLAKLPGWARGLDSDGRFYYVGQSVHRHYDKLRGVADTIPINAGFYIVDAQTKVSKFYATPEIENIHALVVL